MGGVVIALHGAGQRASHTARDWADALELGYALVSVESSQLMSPMYRSWPDQESAAEGIAWAAQLATLARSSAYPASTRPRP
ncbi:hypothetical protein [Kribbella alba]